MRLLSLLLSLSTLLAPCAHASDIPEDKPICTRPFPKPTSYTFSSTHAEIAVLDSGGAGKPVVFVHGNSFCKEFFAKQFQSGLVEQYRLIAIDLPGHGQSSKAHRPEQTYNVNGYSQVLMECINGLHLENPFLVGWSMGGHVVLDALAKGQKCAGVLITGTPPIEMSYAGFEKGFLPMPELMSLWGKERFTQEEALLFINACHCPVDLRQSPFALDTVLKTDGKCRSLLMKSIGATPSVDQKTLVETNETPLCVILGSKDKLNLDYVTKQVRYKNLFQKKVFLIEGSGHFVFWEQPSIFNSILADFLTNY